MHLTNLLQTIKNKLFFKKYAVVTPQRLSNRTIVPLKSIKVPNYMKHSWISEDKFRRKLKYWLKTGEFESKIILDKDYNLKDGYSSYRIAYINYLDKVPVYFER